MSKLEQLIEKLSPNGVEYKQLQEFLIIKNGSDYKKFGEGDIPVYGSGGIMTYIDRFAYDKPSVLIPRKGSIDKLYYVDTPFWNVDTIFYTDIDTTKAIPKYVYHCLLKEHLEQYNTGGGVPSLTQKVLNKVKIPLPPLEIQKEIVRILDNFTELTAELETELTARKKQYEYYRDLMLAFAVHGRTSECEWRALGEVADLLSGFPFDSKKFASNGIRLMRGMNIKRGYLDFSEGNNRYWASAVGLEKYELLNDDIVIAMDGSLVGKSFGLISENQLPLLLVQRVARIRARKNYNNRYIYYCITSAFSSYVDSQKTEGAVPHISLKDISNFKIPVPPLEEQTRIVNIIDRFDKLCNNISEGLPAEIEARRKQYEYYRDKLLTFKAR